MTQRNQNHIAPFLWMRGENETTIRNEIGKIAECGIGAFCVEARPHDGFCGPTWWRDMDIVLDEAKKRGMHVWILDDKHFPTGYANGLIEKKYPERNKIYLDCTTMDVFGKARPLSLDLSRMSHRNIGFWEIQEQQKNFAAWQNNRLLSLTALRFTEGDTFLEDAVDLTPLIGDGKGIIRFTLPEGQWRIHAVFTTTCDGGRPSYINMLDPVSAATQIEAVYEPHYAHYHDLFGSVIQGFFSDEPEMGNYAGMGFDTKLGKKGMVLPWSAAMEERLQKRCGTSFTTDLPFLFARGLEKDRTARVRYDYMDLASSLYMENFSMPIGSWCHQHGVEYIGHVIEDNGVHNKLGHGDGHYFRAMAGQDMAGIDVIGGQIYFGAPVQIRKGMHETDGEFFHYTLGKLGASAGHLDPGKKGRTMCELFGAYGWSFGVRDMKHLLDHLLTRGINNLVPHAFSMAAYPDPDCPPHFYAGGHNPEFPFFGDLMRYANRMCSRLSGGTHKAAVAVLYDADGDWAGDAMPLQKICRTLTEHQIEYDIVPLDLLRDKSAENGTLTINGVSFQALLVPWAECLPEDLTAFAQRSEGFPVAVMNALPEKILNGKEDGTALPLSVLPLEEAASWVRKQGFEPVSISPSFPQLSVYEYRTDREEVLVMNESAEESWTGSIRLPFGKEAVVYDGFRDAFYSVPQKAASDGTYVSLHLAPGECVLLLEKQEGDALSGEFHAARHRICDLSGDWDVTLQKPLEEKQPVHLKELTPINLSHPDFSGTISYEKSIRLKDDLTDAAISMENVFDVVRVSVDGIEKDVLLTAPWEAGIGDLSRGEHQIRIEVATTPLRDVMSRPLPPFDFTHEALEDAGLYGKVTLLARQ